MIDMLRRVFMRQRDEGHEEIQTPTDESATFVLRYDDLNIGHLTLRNGLWQFRYSADFAEQDEIKPLVDFPDLRRTYESRDLWPFFLSRIPSLSQPQVLETIRTEQLDPHNSVDLLRRFGTTSIANPFTLTYVAT